MYMLYADFLHSDHLKRCDNVLQDNIYQDVKCLLLMLVT